MAFFTIPRGNELLFAHVMEVLKSTYRRILVGIAVIAFCSGPLYARQESAVTLSPEKAITQYRLSSWTTLDGLPQNSVGAIVQTPDGYIWLGTQEGLVRFDGMDFEVFDRKNTDAFRVSQVNQLAVSPDGTLRMGTRGGGLVSYSAGQFSTINTDNGLSNDVSMSLFADGDGTAWVGTYGGGLNHVLTDTTISYQEDEGLFGPIVSVVNRDAEGRIIAGTPLGLFYLDDGHFLKYDDPSLANEFITTFFIDSRGAEWFGMRDGRIARRYKGDYQDLSEAPGMPGGYLKAVAEDTEGTLWFAFNGGGLVRYLNGTFSAITEEEGLSSNRMTALMVGREGGLWIGTSGGLNRLQDGKFTTFTSLEGLGHENVMSVHEDAEGSMWMATHGGGVSRLSGGLINNYGIEEGLSSENILTVESQQDGTVWIGTADAGLNKVTPDGVTHYSKGTGLSGNEIYALHTARDGSLWIGTENGLSILSDVGIRNLTTEDGLSTPFVSDFADHPESGMWVATYDGGLLHVDGDSLYSFTTDDGLYDDGILSLYSDSDGTLWIGTFGAGLNILRDGEILGVDGRQGFFDDTIMAILEDDQGSLWFSSNKGIFRSRKDDLLDVAYGRSERVESVSYGVADGLKTAEANGGQQPAAWKGSDGTLWFAMAAGVASVNPSSIRRNTILPLIQIEGLLADRKQIGISEAIELAPGSDRLEFSYAGLSFPAAENVRYEIMLEGKDSEWTPAGTRREASFTNLDPGDYVFRVRASNSDGVWNEKGAELHFYLKPFFYQTTWFLIVSLLTGLVAAFLAYRARIEQLKARERHLEKVVDERTHDLRMQKEQTERAKEVIEEQADQLKELDRFKTKFFSNISHEFRTPLTMLIGPLENALQGAYGQISDSMRQQSEIMLRNAQRLMRLINQLLDLSKLEDGKMQLKAKASDLVPFLEGLLHSFTPFTDKKSIELSFESEVKTAEVYFEPDKMEKVFFNLLSNAAKFTPEKGKISVSVREAPENDDFLKGALEISVSDTGRGIPADDLPYIFDRFRQAKGAQSKDQQGTGIGLSLVKELVELHKGRIEVESELEQGTSFRVKLQLGRRHLLDEDIVEIDETEAQGSTASTELAAKGLNYMHQDAQATAVKQVELADDAPTVLVVEDNKDVREYVASILENHYHVKQAEDGVEGLEKTGVLLPDLIVSDVNMPRMNGNEMCQAIKEDARLNHIPILLLTARASFEGKMSGLEVGADDYMAKPFNAKELIVRTQNLIKLRMQDKQLKILNEDLEAQVQAQLELILTEREEYEEQLIVERDRAQASSKLKSSILDNVNHEFRTPLSTIMGYSQILVEEAPPELQEFASAIDQGGQRLLRTLNSVIDLANLESTDFESDRQNVDLKAEMDIVHNHWSSEAELKGLDFALVYDASAPIEMVVSAMALTKVLHILIDNALKFTEKGFVHLNVDSVPEAVQFVVSDSGVGIDEANQKGVFEAFVQGDTGLTRSHEGTGIGLSIAHRLVERMNGRIEVESKAGEGAAFTLTIPISIPESTGSKDRDARPSTRNRGLPSAGIQE